MDDYEAFLDRNERGEFHPNDAGWTVVTHWCPKCGAVVTNGQPETGEHKPGCSAPTVSGEHGN
jgi:hypothetical protein